MSENDKNERKISIKEIILIFSDIDVKINALNECSAEDFLALNTNLKKYYKQANSISLNINNIHNIVTGPKHKEFYDSLIAVHSDLEKNIAEYKKNVKVSIKGLEKMLTALNLMFIPLKNFNLNLLTLNFLIVNLKLNVAYSTKGSVPALDADTEKINSIINHLKNTLPDLSDNLLKVKNISRISAAKLIDNRKRNLLDVDKIAKQINTSIAILNTKQQEGAQKLPELTKRSNNYFQSVDKIITNLQYHDIIRQKMEHVQATHKEIIRELNEIDSAFENGINLSETAQQFLQIKDIAALQIAQLISTNREYQGAFSNITKKFWDISEDMSGIAQMCSEFIVDEYETSDKYYRELDDKLKNVVVILNRLLVANDEFGNQIIDINQTIIKKELIVKEIISSFETLAEHLVSTAQILNSEFTEDQGIQDIKADIELITSILNENISDVNLFYNQALNISSKLIEPPNSHDTSVMHNLKELEQNVQKILLKLSSNNELLQQMLEENNNFGLLISAEIKSAVEQAKYYDFFEKIMHEIIQELNSVYYRLDTNMIDVLRKNKKDNLESIEKRYTMETQRQIHNQVLQGSNENIKDNFLKKEDDSDIEFF